MLQKIRFVLYVLAFLLVASCATFDSSMEEKNWLHELPGVLEPGQIESDVSPPLDLEKIIAASAPVLNTASGNQSMFRFRIQFPLNTWYEIDCAFDGDQRKKCIILDLYDGVPIFIAANEQVLMYDAGSGVYVSNDLGWSVSIGSSESQKALKFRWSVNKKEKGSQISIDLRPIIKRAPYDRSVEQIDQNRFRYLAHTKSGARLDAIFDTSGMHYESFSLLDEGGPKIIVKTLVVGQQIPLSTFQFPRIPRQMKITPFPDFSDKGLVTIPKSAEIARLIMGHYMVREAIRQPNKRTKLEKQMGIELDWEILAETDAKISLQLRSLISH